jgi:hypothetical protein
LARRSRDLKEAYLLAANAAGGLEGLVGYLPLRTALALIDAYQAQHKDSQ